MFLKHNRSSSFMLQFSFHPNCVIFGNNLCQLFLHQEPLSVHRNCQDSIANCRPNELFVAKQHNNNAKEHLHRAYFVLGMFLPPNVY